MHYGVAEDASPLPLNLNGTILLSFCIRTKAPRRIVKAFASRALGADKIIRYFFSLRQNLGTDIIYPSRRYGQRQSRPSLRHSASVRIWDRLAAFSRFAPELKNRFQWPGQCGRSDRMSLAFSPPDVLIRYLSPIAVHPSSVNFSPVPFGVNPRSSIAHISAIVKQSCTSAKLISLGPRPAILYAPSRQQPLHR